MSYIRAVLAAVAASTALTFVATAKEAGSPLSSALDFGPTIVAAGSSAVSTPDDSTPVPEPVSTALFGIGISSLITYRRFRKMFN